MCNWTIDWGNVPAWVGAIGTLLALAWAVFLYSRSLADQRKSQARLLAPIGETAPVQVLPGDKPKDPSMVMPGLVAFVPGQGAVFVAEAYYASIRLVSTSDEAFSGLRVQLITPEGKKIDYPTSFAEIGPHEDKEFTIYFPPGHIAGYMKVHLTFQDANGRWWERTNGQPVRELRGRDRPSEGASS